jgi:hypothetical protein
MKQKIQVMVLAGLVVIAAGIWYFETRSQRSVDARNLSGTSYEPLAVVNQRLHWSRLESSRKTEYAKTVRDIFSEVVPPPPIDPKKMPPPAKIEPPKPTVAPLPVKFYGLGAVPANGARLAFFTDGDNVFIVREGETLLGRFRILHIGNSSLEYEELANGLRGTAILEEQGPSA